MTKAMDSRVFAWSSACAFTLVFPGLLEFYDFLDIPWSTRLEGSIGLLLPGMIPAMIVSQNVHDPSPAIAVLVSYVFWLYLSYKLIRWGKQRRERNNASA